MSQLFTETLDVVGPRIVESLLMVDRVEDWSRVRSPARARRRLRYGHKQNIAILHVPKKEAISTDGGKTLIMHPAMAKALREHVAARTEEFTGNLLTKTLYGGIRP